MRTARQVEEVSEKSGASQKVTQRRGKPLHENSLKNLKPFVKGQSGNPGGRPKHDVAKEIAQAIFDNDADAIYKAFAKTLRGGNAYAFTVLAERAFGKMKETIVHEGLEVLSEKINKIKARKAKSGSSRTAAA